MDRCTKGIDPTQCPGDCTICDIEKIITESKNPQQIATQLGFEFPRVRSTHRPFICPKTVKSVVVPCTVKGCEFYTDLSWASNCLLAYMEHHSLEQLKPEDISILIRMPIERVNEILITTLTKLRGEMVAKQQEENEDDTHKFGFIATRKVCCVCESPINRAPLVSLEIQNLNLAYCSKACKQSKPPRVIALEHKLGADFKVILQIAKSRFRTTAAMEQALGLDRWTIQDLILQYGL